MSRFITGVDFVQFKCRSANLDHILEVTNTTTYANTSTGEVKYPINSEHGPLFISVNKDHEVRIKGSLHKLYNWIIANYSKAGLHNHNQFTFEQLNQSLDWITETFKLDLSECYPNGLENGYNLPTLTPPKEIINDRIILWKDKTHSKKSSYKGTGAYKQFASSAMIMKTYSKSDQFRLNAYKTRIEAKYTTSRAINKIGVQSMQDLRLIESHMALQDDLKNAYDDLLILDDYDQLELPQSDEKLLTTFSNESKIKALRKVYSRQTISRRKLKFSEVVRRYNLDKTQREITALLDNIIDANSDVYNDLRTQDQRHPIVTFTTLDIDCNRHSDEIQTARNYTESKAIRKKDPKTTKIIWIYPQEIQHLHNDHPLKKRWRNEESNARNNKRKKYKKIIERYNQPSLFGSEEMPIEIPKKDYQLLAYFFNTDLDVLKNVNYVVV